MRSIASLSYGFGFSSTFQIRTLPKFGACGGWGKEKADILGCRLPWGKGGLIEVSGKLRDGHEVRAMLFGQPVAHCVRDDGGQFSAVNIGVLAVECKIAESV